MNKSLLRPFTYSLSVPRVATVNDGFNFVRRVLKSLRGQEKTGSTNTHIRHGTSPDCYSLQHSHTERGREGVERRDTERENPYKGSGTGEEENKKERDAEKQAFGTRK